MCGFYRSGYTQEGEKKWMVVTQFEACDARRGFPCWDEPSVKSKFTAILRVDKALTALSNTLVVSEEIVGIFNPCLTVKGI
jgi:aminopeptidase N